LVKVRVMNVLLSIVFCLTANASECQTVRPVQPDGFVGIAGCTIEGQQEAAAWLEEHPKWRLDRIKCTLGNKPKEDNT
jgi:hypothetical protein